MAQGPGGWSRKQSWESATHSRCRRKGWRAESCAAHRGTDRAATTTTRIEERQGGPFGSLLGHRLDGRRIGAPRDDARCRGCDQAWADTLGRAAQALKAEYRGLP